jgi:hypothetical protein
MISARARRILLRALVAFGLCVGAAPAFAAQALPPPPDPWSYRYHPCADTEVAPLVGMPREDALARIKGMNIKTIRVLAPDTRVLTAPDPQRLTVVIAPNGVVARAFCR